MSLQILLSQIPNTILEVPPFFKYTSDSQLTHLTHVSFFYHYLSLLNQQT